MARPQVVAHGGGAGRLRESVPIDADGWLHTGDGGVLDPAGNLCITDRIKDMFIVGGFNA